VTIEYDTLPGDARETARLYVERGLAPGGFMRAVLENNLVQAFGHADAHNLVRMYDYADWLYNDVPADAWGSAARVQAWIDKGGLVGREPQGVAP
jgi:hypothetical protein